jgi:hypothetical protein
MQAYASYMKGNLLFEQDQNWDTALMNFKSARCILVSFNMLMFTIDTLLLEMNLIIKSLLKNKKNNELIDLKWNKLI